MRVSREAVPVTDLHHEVNRLAKGSAAPLAAARSVDGWVERAGSPENSIDARFEIGSVSKAITGALLGVLVEAGDIDPESPIDELRGEHLPWAVRSPTLLELATHRSGLPNTPSRLRRREAAVAIGWSTADPWQGVDSTVYEKWLAEAATRAKIRERGLYSSMGVGLLGEGLARALGTELTELFRERLFAPLGMNRTGFDRPRTGADVVIRGVNRTGRQLPYLHDQMPAAGMLVSTLDDLTRLTSAILGEGPAVITSGLRRAVTPISPIGKNVNVGYCWFTSDDEHGHVVVHNGATWGSQAHVSAAPDRERAAVLLSGTYRNLDTLGMRILNTP